MYQEFLAYLTYAHVPGEVQCHKEVICKEGKPPWSKKSNSLIIQTVPLVLDLEAG